MSNLYEKIDLKGLDENNIKPLSFCDCEYCLDINDATPSSLILTFDHKTLPSSVFVCNFEHVLLLAGLNEIKQLVFSAGIYLFKFNNGNVRTMCENCSKFTTKTPVLLSLNRFQAVF